MGTLTVEDISVEAGHPAAGVTLTGTGVVSLVREDSSGGRAYVRTARHLEVLGETFVEDHELPVGVPVTYTVEVESGGGVWSPVTIMVRSPYVWLSDPLDHTSGVPVALGTSSWDRASPVLTVESLTDITLGVDGEAVRVVGAVGPPVWLGGSRQAPEGVRLTCVCTSETQMLRVRRAVSVPLLLVRAPVETVASRTWTMAGAVRVEHWPGTDTWQVSVTGRVVAPSTLPVLVTRWTYDQVQQLLGGMTYAQVGAVFAAHTYAQIDRDPER